MNSKIVKDATDYALKLGIDPSLFGYTGFIEAVSEFASDENTVSLSAVCKRIGERHSLNGEAVFRTISYALKTARNITKNIYDITGIKVQESDIHAKYVIRLMAQFIRRDVQD